VALEAVAAGAPVQAAIAELFVSARPTRASGTAYIRTASPGCGFHTASERSINPVNYERPLRRGGTSDCPTRKFFLARAERLTRRG
jgi:hypothetical protein